MGVMRNVADDNFRDRLAAYILERYPQTIVQVDGRRVKVRDLGMTRMKDLVAGGIERGRGNGLQKQSALAAFVTTQFIAAPNFDTDKVLRNILDRADLTDDRRMSVLAAAATDEDWRRVRAAYDPLAWPARGKTNA